MFPVDIAISDHILAYMIVINILFLPNHRLLMSIPKVLTISDMKNKSTIGNHRRLGPLGARAPPSPEIFEVTNVMAETVAPATPGTPANGKSLDGVAPLVPGARDEQVGAE